MLNTKKFRKAISAVTMLATVVALSGVAMLATTVKGAPTGPIVDGDLISSNAKNPDGTPTVESLDIYVVKVINGKKFKRIILNPSVFTSYQHLKWENVREVDQSVMDSYTTSSLTRVDGDQKVWALTPQGDTGAKSWINLTAADFLAAGSDPESIYTINAVDSSYYVTRADIATVDALKAFYKDGTLPDAPVTASLSATLAASNPASQTLVAGQAYANLAEFQLTGTADVKSINLERIGVSADATLKNVYLYDGDTRLTDAASVANGVITFSADKLFSVSGSKTVTVRADIEAGTSGQTVGVKVVGITAASGGVAGLPLTANIHNIATATLATVEVAASAIPADVNIDAGQAITLWQETVNVGVRDVTLSRLALREMGSIASNEVVNFSLFVDGTQVQTGVNLDANDYITFTTPVVLKTGARDIKVTADVVGGFTRTIQLSLRGAQDLVVTDSQYKVGVATSSANIPADSDKFTVNAGAITVVRATSSPAGDIVLGATNQTLAVYDFNVYQESVKVENLKLDIDSTGIASPEEVTLQNVRVLVNGTQVGSTVNFQLDSAAKIINTNFTVVPGTTTKVEIVADIVDGNTSDGADADDVSETFTDGDTLTAVLAQGSNNAYKTVSLERLNTPFADLSGNALTITQGDLTIVKTSNYGNQNVVAPTGDTKLASFQVTAEGETAVISSFDIDLAGTTVALQDLSNIYVTYGGTKTSPRGTISTNTVSFPVNTEVAAGATMEVNLFGTIGSGATAAEVVNSTLDVITKGKVSGETYAIAPVAGQTITVSAGSVSIAGNTVNDVLVAEGKTAITAKYTVQAVNTSYDITQIKVTAPGDVTAVTSYGVYDGDTLLATAAPAANMTFNIAAGKFKVDANTSKDLTVKAIVGTIGTGYGQTGANIQTDLASYDFTNGSGGTGDDVANAVVGSPIYAYKTVPTIVKTNVTNTAATGGDQELLAFTITSEKAASFKEFTVNVSATAGLTGNPRLVDENGTEIAAAVTAAAPVYTIVLNNELVVTGTKTLKVMGDITPTGNVVTSLAKDAAYAASDTYANATAANDIVWSDRSALPHSVASSDWTGSFGFKTFPITQTLTK